MKKLSVIKHNGQKEPYKPQKVLDSIIRANVDSEKAQRILLRVERKLYDGIPTQELYQIVSREIIREGLPDCCRLYRLREALAIMGPIDFEKFVKEILLGEGYQAKWNVIVPGFCSKHQIDVLIKDSSGQSIFVEVKHHRNYHRDSGLGEVIELWGRLEDLQKGYQKNKHPHQFSQAWLITNTKFSAHAKKYGACKKLLLTGWRYALKEDGLPDSAGSLEEELKRAGFPKVIKMIKKVIDEEFASP